MLIIESFNSLQVLILELLSMFGLRDLDTFLVLKLITDVMAINRPDTVENIFPSSPHLICSPFLEIVEDMLYHGPAQPLVLIV